MLENAGRQTARLAGRRRGPGRLHQRSQGLDGERAQLGEGLVGAPPRSEVEVATLLGYSYGSIIGHADSCKLQAHGSVSGILSPVASRDGAPQGMRHRSHAVRLGRPGRPEARVGKEAMRFAAESAASKGAR